MKQTLIRAAIGVAALSMAAPAQSADLGGNCCADLEERIAELEAMTARKGNRKVSLTISGWVSSQLYWFDDGLESNLYVVDSNHDLSSNVKFGGTAQISPGWKAGFNLWIYTNPVSSLTANDTTTPGGGGLVVNQSYWFVESEKLGKVSVGHLSMGADNATVFTDFSGTLFPANAVTFDGGFLRVVNKATGAYAGSDWQTVGFWCEHIGLGIANDCAGLPLDGVRYDTPSFGGFSFTASWAADDYWDVVGRYNGEFAGFKLAASAAYSESNDKNVQGIGIELQNDNQYFQVGGMLKHLASGLWAHGSYGRNSIDNGPNFADNHPDNIGWYSKVGWTHKFTSLGNTHFYGEYGRNQDGFAHTATLDGAAVLSSEVDRMGVGVVQEIDAASMSLWAKWRRHELDATTTAGEFSAEDVNMLLAGAVIFY